MDVTKRMTMALMPGEAILKEGPANLLRGIENVGGRLFLTNARVHFHGHAFNVQAEPTTVPLAEISEVEVGMTRVLGVPLAANSIVIRTIGGREYRLTVQRRAEWKAAIDSALAATP